jgi:uncharacterized YigZ family protein
MSVPDHYSTIAAEVAAELTVKGSKFIANAAPVETKVQAEEYVHAISKRFHDATHHCFAYKIGVGGRAAFRCSDAGEPSGTAGRPILQAIETKKFTNLVVVVARYFGGVKLGTGGLTRAYSSVALAALNHAEIIPYYPKVRLSVRFAFPQTNLVHQVLNKFRGEIVESRFDDGAHYLIEVNAAEEANFRHDLQNLASGKIIIQSAISAN